MARLIDSWVHLLRGTFSESLVIPSNPILISTKPRIMFSLGIYLPSLLQIHQQPLVVSLGCVSIMINRNLNLKLNKNKNLIQV